MVGQVEVAVLVPQVLILDRQVHLLQVVPADPVHLVLFLVQLHIMQAAAEVADTGPLLAATEEQVVGVAAHLVPVHLVLVEATVVLMVQQIAQAVPAAQIQEAAAVVEP